MRFSPLRAARFNGSWSSGGSVIAGKPDSTPKRERVSFRRVRPRPIIKTSRPKADFEKVTVREVSPATKGAGGGRNDNNCGWRGGSRRQEQAWPRRGSR